MISDFNRMAQILVFGPPLLLIGALLYGPENALRALGGPVFGVPGMRNPRAGGAAIQPCTKRRIKGEMK